MESEFSIHLKHSMRYFILSFVWFITCCATPVLAIESSLSSAPAGDEIVDAIGPSIERRNALGYDPTKHSLLPDFYYRYRSWNEEINKKLGLETVFSYDMLAQGYADKDRSLGASAGDTTFSGRWLMFGQKYNRPVYLSFRLRYRHAYGDLAPSQLSSATGLIWKTVHGFTNAGFQIPNLYVSHEIADKRLALRYGQFSIDHFFDNHNLRSAKWYFLNEAFSHNPSIAFPSYGAGFTGQWKDSGNWDLAIGGSNIQGTDKDQTINFSLNSSALFYTAQGGYNFKGFGKRHARVQLLGWQSRGNQEDELPDGTGVSLTLEQEGISSGEHFVARYAFSDGNAALVNQLFMLGWGREIRKYDHYGLGFGLGRSARESSRWQGLAEIYYRWQVTKELVITPDLQIIMGEGLADGNTVQIVAGLRAGIAF
jgi:porin